MVDSRVIREGDDPKLDRKYFIWRVRTFLGIWLAYAGFYLCRKTIAVAQPEYMKQFGWREIDVGIILSGYLTAYAIGQFINGAIGDRYGARVMLVLGLTCTLLMNFFFGFSYTILIMFFLWSLNGYAQSFGWPSSIRGMTNWFSVRERGKIMGPWGTCYTVGDIVGTGLAAFVVGHVVTHTVTNPSGVEVTYADWRWIFWVAALVLAVVTVVVFLLIRNRPEDVGLPSIGVYHNQIEAPKEETAKSVDFWKNTRNVLRRKPVWILGITYFGLKFIRYTFMFWIPTYLTLEKGLTTETAGYVSTFFASAGIVSTFFSGFASDMFFKSRRAPISVIMLLGLVLALFLFKIVPNSTILITAAIALVGFMIYGPDFLVSAVAVMDFGSKEGASTAAGFVNGLGSIGAAIMPIIVGAIATFWGWGIVFYLLIVLALLCAVLMATMWNQVGTS